MVQLHLGPRVLTNPAFHTACEKYWAVAQLGERLVCNQEVAGSIPTSSTSSSEFFLCSLTIWKSVLRGAEVVFSREVEEQNRSEQLLTQCIKSKFLTSTSLLMHHRYLCVNKDFWLSYEEHAVDALALVGDEGRGYLR